MIILNCHIGRMSNHKVMLAHVMATALSHGERWRIAEGWFWRLEGAIIGRVWNRLVRMLPDAVGSRNRCFRLPGLTIVHGWTELRDFEAMKSHGDQIRAYFRRVNVGKWRRDDETVVGIHKRRGDYRTWQGGRFFYNDSVYERVMEEMRQQLVSLQSTRPVRFEIFSDENPVRGAEEDQQIMAECDYLIGPPSTFTLWASFMGKVPLLHLMSQEQRICLMDFERKWE